jgi:hypothetical protein
MDATTATALENFFTLQALRGGTVKGYANEKTMRRSLADVLARVAEEPFAAQLVVATIPCGKHAGRVVPVLAFPAGASVPQDAVVYAFHGVVVFCPRA